MDSIQKRAISITNRLIKKPCTVFCLKPPLIVLPLPRSSFVKTTLGKISHSQLSKSYLEGNFNDLQAALKAPDQLPLDAVEMFANGLVNPVAQLVAEVIPIVFSVDILSLHRLQSFFDMGASSMHLLQLKQIIQERLSLPDFLIIEMPRRPQIGELCDYLSEVVVVGKRDMKEVAVKYDPTICMNTAGSKPPLLVRCSFLWH